MLSLWSRAICALVACGCYNPSPVEGLACSETDHCPDGQSCDLAFHQCAAFPLCAPPSIADPFLGSGAPCVSWGTQFGNAIVEASGGVLAITPAPDFQNSGGCVSSAAIPFGKGGIFLEVLAVLPPGHGFVELTAGGGPNPVSIGVDDGKLELGFQGTSVTALPYDAAAMRWWRLRPDPGAGTTVGEYAADGSHWMRLGAVDMAPEPEVTIELSAGTDAPDPSPATAKLAHFDICPDRPAAGARPAPDHSR